MPPASESRNIIFCRYIFSVQSIPSLFVLPFSIINMHKHLFLRTRMGYRSAAINPFFRQNSQPSFSNFREIYLLYPRKKINVLMSIAVIHDPLVITFTRKTILMLIIHSHLKIL